MKLFFVLFALDVVSTVDVLVVVSGITVDVVAFVVAGIVGSGL